ncbi:hypothetical protein M2273_001293 [Mucilaginibacter lappiensis]
MRNVLDREDSVDVNFINGGPERLVIKDIIKPFFIHLFIGTVIFATGDYNKILIPILWFFAVFFFKRNNVYFLLTAVYSVCFPSEVVYYAFAVVLLILLFLRKKKGEDTADIKWIKKCAKIFFISCILLYLIQLVIQRSVLSFPLFCLTFISPSIIMFYVWKMNITNKDLRLFFRQLLAIAMAQGFIAVFFEAVPKGIGSILSRATLGDTILGTTNSSTSLAILLFFSILPFLTSYSFKKKKGSFWLFFISFGFLGLVILNDSKTTFGAILLSVLTVIFQKHIFLNKNVFKSVLYSLLIITVTMLSISIIEKKIEDKQAEYEDYINGRYNMKVEYYGSTFSPDTRSIFEYLIGTGPGTNGSRAANSLAYDILYKKPGSAGLPTSIPPKSNEFTKKYLSHLYTEDYAKSTGSRSAVLGNPFNSACAFFIEFGLIGFLVLAWFLFKLTKKFILRANWISITVACMIISNVITAFIDQTLESVVPMFLTYLMIGLACKSYYSLKVNT